MWETGSKWRAGGDWTMYEGAGFLGYSLRRLSLHNGSRSSPNHESASVSRREGKNMRT